MSNPAIDSLVAELGLPPGGKIVATHPATGQAYAGGLPLSVTYAASDVERLAGMKNPVALLGDYPRSIILARSAVPVIRPRSGTFSSGSLTIDLTSTTDPGWLVIPGMVYKIYLPTGAGGVPSEGLYDCTITAWTYPNMTILLSGGYVGSGAFVTAGDTINKTVFSTAIPANLLGANGRVECLARQTNFGTSTNSKKTLWTLDGNEVGWSNSNASNYPSFTGRVAFNNRGVANRQMGSFASGSPSIFDTVALGYGHLLTSVDTTNDTTLRANCYAGAAETVIYDYFQVTVIPGS